MTTGEHHNQVGTVRQENHLDGSLSIWVRCDNHEDRHAPSWFCVHSERGQAGQWTNRVSDFPVIGGVPGTPAE